MEDREYTLLNKSRMQIRRIGKAMNVFSIFAALGMLFMVIGGIILLAYGSSFDQDMPRYLSLLLSFAGIGLILLVAVLIVPLVYMRRSVHAAAEVANNTEIHAIIEYNRWVGKLWRFMTRFLVVLFALGVIGSLVAGLYILSAHNAF